MNLFWRFKILMGFSKLDDAFWRSSINDAPPFARLLFLSLWALCNERGEFKSTISGLARHAALSEDDVRAALAILTSPDPNSTTPDYEGRRVLELGPNQWKVVNYEKNRDQDDAEARRQYWRQKKADQRISSSRKSKSKSPSVPKAQPTEKSSTFSAPTREECRAWFQARAYGVSEGDRFFNHFENCGWRLSGGKGAKMKNWELAASNWASRLRKPSGSSVEGPSAARVEALKAEMDALESGG